MRVLDSLRLEISDEEKAYYLVVDHIRTDNTREIVFRDGTPVAFQQRISEGFRRHGFLAALSANHLIVSVPSPEYRAFELLASTKIKVNTALLHARAAEALVGGECAKECPAYGLPDNEGVKECNCGWRHIMFVIETLKQAKRELQ